MSWRKYVVDFHQMGTEKAAARPSGAFFIFFVYPHVVDTSSRADDDRLRAA